MGGPKALMWIWGGVQKLWCGYGVGPKLWCGYGMSKSFNVDMGWGFKSFNVDMGWGFKSFDVDVNSSPFSQFARRAWYINFWEYLRDTSIWVYYITIITTRYIYIHRVCRKDLAQYENIIISAHHSRKHCVLYVYLTANHHPPPHYCTYITHAIIECDWHTYMDTYISTHPELTAQVDALCKGTQQLAIESVGTLILLYTKKNQTHCTCVYHLLSTCTDIMSIPIENVHCLGHFLLIFFHIRYRYRYRTVHILCPRAL